MAGSKEAVLGCLGASPFPPNQAWADRNTNLSKYQRFHQSLPQCNKKRVGGAVSLQIDLVECSDSKKASSSDLSYAGRPLHVDAH